MKETVDTDKKPLKLSYVIIPVIIGLTVVGWLFWREFNPQLFSDIHFSWRLAGGLLLAFLFMFGRDGGLIARFRWLSEGSLSWRQAFNVNMLCEFTSAVTPSAVGGSSLIALFLNKEGINAGRSTALMISCLFLDELFLVVACPLALAFFSFNELFGNISVFSEGVKLLFFIIYGVVTVWTILLYTALFHRPEWVKRLLMAIFRLPVLRRWNRAIEELTDNLVVSSHQISGKPLGFWLRAFGLTVLAWVSRYLVVNAVLFAFITDGNQWVAFVRQLVLWIVMTISPTPGGSGISEYMFQEYYADFFTVPGMALVVAFVWRIITYYMYLIIGVSIIPGWLKKFNN